MRACVHAHINMHVQHTVVPCTTTVAVTTTPNTAAVMINVIAVTTIRTTQSVTLPRGIVELAVSTSNLFHFGHYIALSRVSGEKVLTIWSSF